MSAALEVEQNASHEGSKVGKEGYDYILQRRQNKTGSELSKGNDVAAKVWAVWIRTSSSQMTVIAASGIEIHSENN